MTEPTIPAQDGDPPILSIVKGSKPADADTPLVLAAPANFRIIKGICSRCHQSGDVVDLYASHDSGFADGYSVDDLRLCRGCLTAAGFLFGLTENEKLLRQHKQTSNDRDTLAAENGALRRTLNKITEALKQHA